MKKRSLRTAWFVLAHFTGALLLAGCGPGGPPAAKRYKVSGTVTLDGEAVESGMINFLDPKVSADGGTIKNGSFSFATTAGEKRVEIYATKPSDKTVEGKDGVTLTESLIPEKYNSKSTLKETVEEHENVFNFELESGK